MGRINMYTLAEEINAPEGYLLTRPKGALAYPRLADKLTSMSEGESLFLDFADIPVVDVSFFDESIIRLLKEILDGKFENRRVVLENLTDDAITNINAAINVQKLRLSLISIDKRGDWKLLGHIEKSLMLVFEMIMERGSITAPQLADHLDIALNAANNRLKRLLGQRLIRRDYEVTDNGLLYTYHRWDWAE